MSALETLEKAVKRLRHAQEPWIAADLQRVQSQLERLLALANDACDEGSIDALRNQVALMRGLK